MVFPNRQFVRLIESAAFAAFANWCLAAHAGYTHYFTWQQPPDDAALKQCVAEMNQLIAARKSILVCPDLSDSVPGSPTLQASKVDFNGIGDDAHEPFVFPGGSGFNFCKTAYKPYDEVVTACLIVARDHFSPSVLEIKSDGEWDDWANGVSLYTSVFKRPARNPMLDRPYGSAAGKVSAVIFVCLLLSVPLAFWAKGKMRSRNYNG